MPEDAKLEVPVEIISTIVQCINGAVGDKIKEDIKKQNLVTKNSIPTRIWDLLNRDLCEVLNSPDCMAYEAKRGCWGMVIIHEKSSENIFTIMREQRFKEIYEKQPERRNMHYLNELTKNFNEDLKAPVGQISFFPKKFDDEDKVKEHVQKLLKNLIKDNVVVKHHALILFNASEYQLTSIRAVMIDTNLDIVTEKDWSSYISIEESTVAEKVDKTNPIANNPTLGLNLTSKAVARKKTHPLKKAKKEEDAK
ncbi:TPA: hypothetical protein KNR44_003278 [Clostridioides difficile]|nr:hypothetical protein [Clostridioides difficile]